MNIKKLNEEIRSLISYITEDEDKFSTVSESTRKSQYLKEDKSTRLEELLDILSNKNYYKINGDEISIKETNSRLAYLSLWDLADTFKSLGYKVHLSHFYLEVEGLQELIKDRQQKKVESLQDNKVSAQDIRRWFESKTKYKKQNDPEFYVRSAVKQFPQLKGKEEELRKNIEKQKAKNKPWYPYMDAVKDTLKDVNAFEESVNEALEDELQVGDTVELRGSQCLQLKTKGTYMNINKLNEELKILLEDNLHEISSELADRVAEKRQQQLDKLQRKVNNARDYATTKRKQSSASASSRIAEIRNRIRLILSDKPGIDTIPSTMFKGHHKDLIKVIKIPFTKDMNTNGLTISEWGYFGLLDDEQYKPVIVFSLTDYHDKWSGWNYEWIGSKYNFSEELPFWEEALKVVEQHYNESEEDIEAKDKKAKRAEYNKKYQTEKKAQKLADSKPFDKFLQELKDKYGSGYIAQDVYGATYVYKNMPYFTPTIDGYEGDEEVYEPGYWTGDRYDNINYESQLNKAYKDQYRKPVPSNDKAIWSF